ncbi:kinase-like domain-containing protein [Rhizophagus clarus]|uniref:Kinase-like domain-containing protein n=1 Tax=Rhizophagus clarus TaxID=94130 RepID=A0A8H3L9Q1_9GLOM|nr:kinase-like domain-containing protein [Rhizophagus clarus]
MELVNSNDENYFDQTSRLKSSPIPIKFISFNGVDENCVYCGEKYIGTIFSGKVYNNGHTYNQKYCEKCLSSYINDITDNNIYLDVYICAMDLECREHEISRTKVPQCIQECCRNCLRILYFKQIDGRFIDEFLVDSSNRTMYNEVIESEKDCKLCGKSLSYTYNRYDFFILCSDCYLISSGLIESTLVKKKISILYLPWWHNNDKCDACYSRLTFASDCQKYCANCYIFYVGCRYCLTTNVIFGPTCQSQCQKCKRISLITHSNEYCGLDDFLNNIIYDNLYNLEMILKTIFKVINKSSIGPIRWISYSQFTNIEEMTEGGYGIIYKATWLNNNETIVLKRFENSKNIGRYFLNELKSCQHFFKSFWGHIIKIYGITKDPELEDYILVMKYASEGDLHKYLKKNFTNIAWIKQKTQILWEISEGLEHIHKKKFMHRDFHSGNILYDPHNNSYNKNYQWKIGDLGLSQAVNDKSSNNEIYGVIPYIAPEVFKGSKFTKESDIYSLGMIMWELTTGCKPFANVKHDIHLIYKILDGERPKITEDTPECYANLMKRCWDADPKNRPSIKDIRLTFGSWVFRCVNEVEFNQAETKRKELIRSKKIGPEFTEEYHSEAIYISRPLSALISECTSTYSSSTTSSDSNYVIELENDTDTKSLSLQNTIQNFAPVLDSSDYISAELEFDIDTESSSSQNLSFTLQNFSTSLKKRSNEVFLNVETYNNSEKRIKASRNYRS